MKLNSRKRKTKSKSFLIFLQLIFFQISFAQNSDEPLLIFHNDESIEPFQTSELNKYFQTVFPLSFSSIRGKIGDIALFVDKSTHILSVYQSNKEGLYELLKSYPAVTGKMQGDKKNSGDLRTPEGIYIITGEKNKKNLGKKYGAGAWILNYPNPFDELKNKTGFGIWLHGVLDDNRIEKLDDTQGCVALRNEDWNDLKPLIQPNYTPIIIADHSYYFSDKKSIEDSRLFIENFLNEWKDAWVNSNFSYYSYFYSSDFSSNHFNKSEWISKKKELSETRKEIEINISNIRYFTLYDEIIIMFEQEYKSAFRNDKGAKSLFLKKEDGFYKIISEKWDTF